MSGLFRRLAQQAGGRAITLHAPARLPFHEAPAVTEAFNTATTEMTAEAPPPIVAAPPRPGAQHVAARPGRVADAPATNTDIAPSTSPAPSTPEAYRSCETASTPDVRDPDTPAEAPAQATNPTRPDRLARHERAASPTRDGPAPFAPPPATPMYAEPPPPRPIAATPPAHRAVTPAAAGAPFRDKVATAEFPPALLPPSAATAQAVTAAASAAQQAPGHSDRRVRNVTTDAPNEVHVHIGRIEVTALQEPAPKPRAKRNGRAPMSLDEYLAKRQRGSS